MSTSSESTVKGSGGEYEFSPQQKGAIRSLTMVMRIAGVAWIVFGLVSAVTLFLVRALPPTVSGQQAAAVIGLVANLVMGFSTLAATASLSRVVDTKGRDISNTVEALTQLQRVFGALRIIIIVALALGVVVFFYVGQSIGGLPFLRH